MIPGNIKQNAVDLRKKGYSLSYISQKTGVSRGTLSFWLRDLPYMPNEDTIANINKARLRSAVSRNQSRLLCISSDKKQVADELLGSINPAVGAESADNGTDRKSKIFKLSKLSKQEILLMGVGIFAGRGKGVQERIELNTSDSKLARLFVIWLLKGLDVPIENISLRLNLFPSHHVEQCKNFWMQALSLPEGSIGHVFIDDRNRQNQKGNPRFGSAPFGSVKVHVKNNGKKEFGVLLFRKVEAVVDAIASIKI